MDAKIRLFYGNLLILQGKIKKHIALLLSRIAHGVDNLAERLEQTQEIMNHCLSFNQRAFFGII